MNASIRALLKEAVRAPSGDNMQPWRFALDGQKLSIRNIPGQDSSLYNWKEYGSYIAHGALLENILSLVPSFGLSADYVLFPSNDEPNLVAEVQFSFAPQQEEDARLRTAIKERHTNRKLFETAELPARLENSLRSALNAEEARGFALTIIKESTKRAALGAAVAQNELVLFSNNALHNFFFSHIHWEKGAQEGLDPALGLRENSLEIPREAKSLFRKMSSFSVAKLLHYLGLTRLIARDNGKIYASGEAIGVISSTNEALTPADYVRFGRLLERLWLTATLGSYRFQPLMGICFLARRLREGGGGFSPFEQKIIARAHETLAQETGLPRTNIVGIFRVGRAPASVATPRLEPVFEI